MSPVASAAAIPCSKKSPDMTAWGRLSHTKHYLFWESVVVSARRRRRRTMEDLLPDLLLDKKRVVEHLRRGFEHVIESTCGFWLVVKRRGTVVALSLLFFDWPRGADLW